LKVESWREMFEASPFGKLFYFTQRRKGAKEFSGNGVSSLRCVFFAFLHEIFLAGIFSRSLSK